MPITGRGELSMGLFLDIITCQTEALKKLRTFPKHFHDGREEIIEESELSDLPEEALRSFLQFARERLMFKSL